MPPTHASAIQAVTSSDVFSWPGIDVQLTWQSKRTRRKNNWYPLTGRVFAVKVEADGSAILPALASKGNKEPNSGGVPKFI